MTHAAVTRVEEVAFVDREGQPVRRPSDVLGEAAEVDESAVASLLGWVRPVDARRTCLAAVDFRDPPTFAWREPAPIPSETAALARRLWDEIVGAVNRTTREFGRVVVAVGGIDSSGVLAALCEVRSASQILAVSLDYGGVDPDRPYVRALCEAYGVDLVELRIADAAKYVEPNLVVAELPSWMFGGVVDHHIFEFARSRGAEAVVTGFSGDDALGGDLGALRLRDVPLLLRSELPDRETRVERLRDRVLAPRVRRFVPRRAQRARLHRHLRTWFPWATPRLRSQIEPALAGQSKLLQRAVTPEEIARQRFDGLLVAMLTRRQLVLEHQVARVDPYLDPELGAFLASVPTAQLFHGAAHRGLYRCALPARVPDAIRRRITKADPTAQIDALARASSANLARWVGVPRLARRGLVDAKRFARAFDELGAADLRVWLTLSVEAFLDRWAA